MTNNQNKRPEKSWWSIMADSIAIIIFVIAIFGMMGTFGTFCHGADAPVPEQKIHVFNVQQYRCELNDTLHYHGLLCKNLRYDPPLLSYEVVPIEACQKINMHEVLAIIIKLHRLNYRMLSLEQDDDYPDTTVIFRRTQLNPRRVTGNKE